MTCVLSGLLAIDDLGHNLDRGRRRAPPLPEHLIWDLEPGLHADGCGLYLRVQQSGSRSWVLIDFDNRRRRERGLGGARVVSLDEARRKARSLKQAGTIQERLHYRSGQDLEAGE